MLYLDNSATTFPKPRQVIKAVRECIEKYCGNPGRSSHALALRASEEIYLARETLGKFLSFSEYENIVFTENATYALNLALKTTIKPRTHIIISDLEHNAVLRPIEKLKRDIDIEYSVFNSDGNIEENIERIIRPTTSAIVSTLMSNVSGKEIPLGVLSGIKKRHGLCLIIDASQKLGHGKIDLKETPCDILCGPAHKALFGIQGAGFAVFCDGQKRDSFIEGGSGSFSASAAMPSELPERFEAGTLPTPSIVSLRAGIEYINAQGLENIERKIKRTMDCYLDMLSDFSDFRLYGARGGIISFASPKISSTLISSELDSFGICTRAGLHCAPLAHKKLGTLKSGLVRISLSALNNEREASKFYSALKYIKRKYF